MNIREIQDLHLETQGASEFATMLLGALGNNGGLGRAQIAEIYKGYVAGKMAEVESLIDAEKVA